jgi:hypothetical protein
MICLREEFHRIVLSIEKIHGDSRQQIKGGSGKPSAKQLQQRIGIKPSLADCLDGLMVLYDMHHSEYELFYVWNSRICPLCFVLYVL